MPTIDEELIQNAKAVFHGKVEHSEDVTFGKNAKVEGQLTINSATNIKDKSLTSADAGKVLTVSNDGNPIWEKPSSGIQGFRRVKKEDNYSLTVQGIAPYSISNIILIYLEAGNYKAGDRLQGSRNLTLYLGKDAVVNGYYPLPLTSDKLYPPNCLQMIKATAVDSNNVSHDLKCEVSLYDYEDFKIGHYYINISLIAADDFNVVSNNPDGITVTLKVWA